LQHAEAERGGADAPAREREPDQTRLDGSGRRRQRRQVQGAAPTVDFMTLGVADISKDRAVVRQAALQ
jgi:hypothetical protein